MKILVADDDAVSRQMICTLLQRKGYEVVQACDGFEALEHLRGPEAAKLAVIDWMMPGLDGVEVCRKLRAEVDSHYVYVILVTARSQKTDLLAGLEAGADDYLSKPFEVSELQVRLQVGQRIIQAEEHLREIQRIEAMGLLTGGIAHDFNNIVMIISSYCEMLQNKLTDPALSSKVEQIRKAGERAAALTHQLLAFSRQQIISPTVFSLNTVISDLTPMLQRLLGERIDCEIKLAKDLWKTKADISQIERVLLNLATNARDAMPNGGHLILKTENVVLGHPFVDSHLGCEPGAYALLSVTDTGCGMTKEVQNRAFDPFFTTKPKGQGTGMGLASVYGIVKQHCGYVGVESEPNKGSTFKIYLPQFEELLEHSTADNPVHTTQQGGSILVVEDEDSTRDAICSYLNSSGYEVISTGNGEDALSMYTKSEKPPSVVVTDVLMPGISGPELAKEILRLNPEAKLIFMSGYADRILKDQMQSMEKFHFLQKPFPLTDLLVAIHEVGSHDGHTTSM